MNDTGFDSSRVDPREEALLRTATDEQKAMYALIKEMAKLETIPDPSQQDQPLYKMGLTNGHDATFPPSKFIELALASQSPESIPTPPGQEARGASVVSYLQFSLMKRGLNDHGVSVYTGAYEARIYNERLKSPGGVDVSTFRVSPVSGTFQGMEAEVPRVFNIGFPVKVESTQGYRQGSFENTSYQRTFPPAGK